MADQARLIVILLLALAVRVLYIDSLPLDSPIESVDAWGYHRLALNLDAGNGFSLRREAPFVPDSVRTPLYPLFLLLIRRTLGPTPRIAVLIQALLDSVTAILVYRLTRHLADSRAGRVAALLYALNPTQVRYVNELLTETMLAFLLTLCMLVFVRYTYCTSDASSGAKRPTSTTWPVTRNIFNLALLSLLTAWCIFCKPNVQFLPLIFALGLALIHRKHWQHAFQVVGCYLSIVGALLAPWVIRNKIVFGRLFLSTAFEGNVSRVSAPATIAQAEWRYPTPWSEEWESDFLHLVEQAAARYHWEKKWEELDARELDRQNHQVYIVARETLQQHPWAWIGSHLQGMLRYLEPQTFKVCYSRISGRPWPADLLDDAPLHITRWIIGGHWAEAWEVFVQERWRKLDRFQGLVLWGTYTGQVIGFWLFARGTWRLRHAPAVVLPILLIIAGALILPGPIAYERFRVPVTGLILGLIVAACARCPIAI